MRIKLHNMQLLTMLLMLNWVLSNHSSTNNMSSMFIILHRMHVFIDVYKL